MNEIDALTKRFKDYIDKIQAAYGESQIRDTTPGGKQSSTKKPIKKLYTVVSPVEAMSNNLKSVLKAIDHAIENIDELSQPSDSTSPPKNTPGVYSSSPGQKKFSEEELDFLVRTFNKILNTPEEERKRLFSKIDKSEKPPKL